MLKHHLPYCYRELEIFFFVLMPKVHFCFVAKLRIGMVQNRAIISYAELICLESHCFLSLVEPDKAYDSSHCFT